MSNILNDNFNTQFPKPIDNRYGPYDNIAEALSAIPLYRRYIGLTIGINPDNIEEYWWKDGLTNADLVAKFEAIPYPVRSVNGQTGDVMLDSDDIPQGVTNEYFTQSKVRATILTGLSTATNAIISATDSVLSAFGKIQAQITANLSTLSGHISNTSNPHSVTKAQVGLSNVDNTSDANKPISSATQTALNAKENTITAGTTAQYYRGDKTFQTLDKTAVGLSNVANVDTTNASNISSGTLSDSRLSANVTTQGNTFNTANKLVQLDATAKLPAVDGSQLTNLPTFNAPDGLLRLTNAISTTLQTITDYLGNLSVLQLNTRRVGILSDSSVTTQTSSVIQSTTNNANMVIAPNGTGALVASIPDGTITGGNARGQYAVDLQMSRGLSTHVASQNYSSILSGANNTISAASDTTYSVIGGGLSNSSARPYTFIGGGSSNSIVNSGGNGERSVISGGGSNTITGSSYSTISGGQSNTTSTNSHAIVVGGNSNTSSGQNSISGGFSCNSSGSRSLAIGDANTASGTSCASFNSLTNANGSYSSSFGRQSNSYLLSQQTLSGGQFSTSGDAQQSILTARNSTSLTTGSTLVLSLDGTGTTSLIIPNGNNRAWNVQIDTIAIVTAISGTATGVSVGNAYSESKNLLFKRIGGTSSIVGTVDTTSIKNDTSMATASLSVTAGASQQMALTFNAPTFAGGGSITIRVVSKVSLVEVAY